MRSVPTQLQDLLALSARQCPDKIALVCQARRVSYAEIEAQSDSLAHWLVQGRVSRGDRVIILTENSVETVVAFWATLKASAVVCLVHPETPADKLAHYLQDTRATMLIADADLLRHHQDVLAEACFLRSIVSANGLPTDDRQGLPRMTAFSQAIIPDAPPGAPMRRNIDIDLAAIIYTSGSTGAPKGVMLTHRNMLTAAASIMEYLRLDERDVILNAMPLSFDYGLYQMVMSFAAGARLVLERSFALLPQVLARASREAVTGLPAVPTVFALLSQFEALDRFDLSAVRFLTASGAHLAPSHIKWMQRRFPNAKIFSMYGLTECKRCTYLPPEAIDQKLGSVGIAIPNTEIWVVDENDRRLGPHQVGEVVVRGATVMRGYWDAPEATAERLRPGPLLGEFVLCTGDLGRLDDDGYLYLVARIDSIFKNRGKKVAPHEVEATMMKISGVVEVVVKGVPDPVLGHAVHAFVVLASGLQLDETQLRRACVALMESHQIPSKIVIMTALPRNGNGKIDRAALVHG
jgi:amino acid adenylation domain-containing protein